MAILYITYDGLLDPLGSSQILPYIKGISKHQDSVIVLSFEKPERMLRGQQSMLSDIMHYGIHWMPLRFTKGFGLAGKLWDLSRMYFWSFYLAYKYSIRIVHARSHSPAQVGLFLKRVLKKKLIFDFRGLWVDERIDKGGWDLSNFFDRLQYKYFKRVEKKLLAQADQIVVLTNKVVSEVVRLGAKPSSKITVIPCCADFNHFLLSTNTHKSKARTLTGIPDDAFVLGHLGSVGSMYMLDRFFHLYELVTNVRDDCHLLIITQDISALEGLMKRYLKPHLYSRVHIKSASRDEVPTLLSAIDVMVSFILPSYARIAASPTKMAECFATGAPVIANPGVGDVASIINELDGGRVANPFSDIDLKKVVQELDEICLKGGQHLRDAAHSKLGLEIAEKCYQSVYGEITKTMIVRE
jgi:glycosyltransferase involved in cell wall biosynthesis